MKTAESKLIHQKDSFQLIVQYQFNYLIQLIVPLPMLFIYSLRSWKYSLAALVTRQLADVLLK